MCAAMVLYFPLPGGLNLGNLDQIHSNGFDNEFPDQEDPHFHESEYQSPQWFEELIEPDLKWSFEKTGTSEYQNIVLLDTNRFGKVLVIDGKMQRLRKDEFSIP
ncbi:hypothetical protein GH714_027014 [Hevea brasiliensis]|uniref:PABS domain-containing protein n=1 Tax=Hevea brasiliensis TaxID=3981 RepID=A0A6A6LST1_HEVBR|nr:hypothetical protein GH714_027014 [Hevea brasiliensis]